MMHPHIPTHFKLQQFQAATLDYDDGTYSGVLTLDRNGVSYVMKKLNILQSTADNRVTLTTCLANHPESRVVVQAVEVRS